MSGEVSESVECSECSYVFQGEELDQDSKERKPCPNCGSLRRNIRLSVKETLGLSEYIGIKAKKQNSKHKKRRADYEFEEGKKIGKDGKPVYKKLIRDREHPNSDNSYQELVIDTKRGKVIVDKHEKLSGHKEV